MSAAIEARLAAIEARLAALESGKGAAPSDKAGKIADDRVFHGQYGNPSITIDPKAWDGPSMKGSNFSDAPIEWLELAASMYDAFGERAHNEGKVDKNGKPVAWRDHQKAALARRWAQEKRVEVNGQSSKAQRAREEEDFREAQADSELPF